MLLLNFYGISPQDDSMFFTPQFSNSSYTIREEKPPSPEITKSNNANNERNDIVMEWALPEASSISPVQATLSVLLVFFLLPAIICANALILAAAYRFKRLRSPSNYFVISLASVDFGFGLLLPPGLYFEFSRQRIRYTVLCLFPYCLFILLGSVSLLNMAAIAADRCISLASPLRYNNIITHKSVLRYIAFFWMASLLLSSMPLLYRLLVGLPAEWTCSFAVAVLPGIRVLLFVLLFLPCTSLIVCSYGYVYFVARSHARAIQNSEVTFRQQSCRGPKYGRTLAFTVGTFLATWVPFQVAMLSSSVDETVMMCFGVLVLSGAAIDPWIYGFRCAEFRLASFKILEEISPHLSGALYKPRVRRQSIPFTSYASHVPCTLEIPNTMDHSLYTMCQTFIEIPMTSLPLEDTAAV